MALTVALDASVLYPLPLRDTLLRAAQVGTYDPDLYRIDPDATPTAIALQAAALTRPPMTVTDILDRLAATVPRFAQALRAQTS